MVSVPEVNVIVVDVVTWTCFDGLTNTNFTRSSANSETMPPAILF